MQKYREKTYRENSINLSIEHPREVFVPTTDHQYVYWILVTKTRRCH